MTAPLHEFAAAPIEECYRQIERPQHAELRKLLAMWDKRPADGFEIGRDIPSRRFAPLLSHILFWEPVDGGTDYKLHLCGEALRLRFGDDAVGKSIKKLIAPDVVPFFLDTGRTMLAEDRCACFDMNLVRREPIEGRRKLHFEMVIFPVWAHRRTNRWILNGTYYFL
jgi:hypothetical protein